MRARCFVVVLVLSFGQPACNWVSFDGSGDDDDDDDDTAHDGGPGDDAGAEECDPACEDGFVCVGGGGCVDERTDEDEDGFPVSVDCDDRDEDVLPGSTRACATACGAGVETCAAGVWGDCSAPEECSCEAGQTRDEPCGRCGLARRTCGDDGRWGELGACEGEGECSPAADEVAPCPGQGACIVQTRTCSDSCTWGEWGECQGQTECEPGAGDAAGCGVCGTHERTCTAGCLWGAWGECLGDEGDGDGDGHAPLSCGGDDCDDAHANAHPGLVEDEEWVLETLDADDSTGWDVILQMDGAGTAHFIYRNDTEGAVRYATYAAGVFSSEIVDQQGDTGHWLDFALDGSGAAHVIYLLCNGSNGGYCYEGDLVYATNAGGAWSVETLDAGGDTGYDGSIGIDANGAVHVSYRECAGTNGGFCYDGDLRYATNAGGAWDTVTVTADGDTGYSTSLAIDANGHVHVGYVLCAGTNGGLCYDGDLQYATNASGAWETETAESDGDSGDEEVAIALDAQGAVHMVYVLCHGSNGGLGCYDADFRHATNAGGAWAFENIDVGDTGYWPSILFDGGGARHVAYYDWENGDLRYGTDASGAWALETLDGEGTDDATGIYTSMVLAAGTLHLAYTDYANGDLRYARRALADGLDNDCDGTAY